MVHAIAIFNVMIFNISINAKLQTLINNQSIIWEYVRFKIPRPACSRYVMWMAWGNPNQISESVMESLAVWHDNTRQWIMSSQYIVVIWAGTTINSGFVAGSCLCLSQYQLCISSITPTMVKSYTPMSTAAVAVTREGIARNYYNLRMINGK